MTIARKKRRSGFSAIASAIDTRNSSGERVGTARVARAAHQPFVGEEVRQRAGEHREHQRAALPGRREAGEVAIQRQADREHRVQRRGQRGDAECQQVARRAVARAAAATARPSAVSMP